MIKANHLGSEFWKGMVIALISIAIFVIGYAGISSLAPKWTGPKWSLGLSTTDWATLISGFGGAILGAGISYFIAKQTAKEARIRDADTRLDQEKAAALRLMLRTTSIVNTIHTILKHIEDPITEASQNGQLYNEDHSPRAIWPFVRPAPKSRGAPIIFDPSDFQPLLSISRADIINEALRLADCCREIQAAFEAYSDVRLEMQQLLSPHSKIDPQTGAVTADLSAKTLALAELKAEELDFLLGQIIDLGHEYREEGRQLCDTVGSELKTYFGPTFPTMSSVPLSDTP